MWLNGGKSLPYILGLPQTEFILEWYPQNIMYGIQNSYTPELGDALFGPRCVFETDEGYKAAAGPFGGK